MTWLESKIFHCFTPCYCHALPCAFHIHLEVAGAIVGLKQLFFPCMSLFCHPATYWAAAATFTKQARPKATHSLVQCPSPNFHQAHSARKAFRKQNVGNLAYLQVMTQGEIPLVLETPHFLKAFIAHLVPLHPLPDPCKAPPAFALDTIRLLQVLRKVQDKCWKTTQGENAKMQHVVL